MTEQAKCTIGTSVMQNGLVIGELYDLAFPETTAESNDTSSQNNSGGVKTTCVGWIENAPMSFKVFYTGSTAQETLRTAIYDRDFDTWTVVMPMDFGNNVSYAWSGQISKCTLVADGSAPAYLDMEVTVNGRISTYTTGAAGLTTPFFSIADDDANSLTPSPAASASVYEYDVETYSDSVSVAITPTATAGTIYVDGTKVGTGVASGPITLNSGVGAVTMVSVAVTELNKTPKIYWIRFRIGTTAQPSSP